MLTQRDLAGIDELVIRRRGRRAFHSERAKKIIFAGGKGENNFALRRALRFHLYFRKAAGIVENLNGLSDFVFVKRLVGLLGQQGLKPVRMLHCGAIDFYVGYRKPLKVIEVCRRGGRRGVG